MTPLPNLSQIYALAVQDENQWHVIANRTLVIEEAIFAAKNNQNVGRKEKN